MNKSHNDITAEVQAKATYLLESDASSYGGKSPSRDYGDKRPSRDYGSYNTPSRCSIQRRPGSGCNVSRVTSDLKALYDSYEVEDQRRRQRLETTVVEVSQKMSSKKKSSVGVLDHRWSRVQGMADGERCRVEKQTRVLIQMEQRWDAKLCGERKKRLEQGVQSSLQIQTVKTETIALIRQERREEVDVLRQQLVDEQLRRKENVCLAQRQQEQIEKLLVAVAGLSDTMLMTKAVLVKEQQLRKQMEADHLTLIKEYHSASTVAIDAERHRVEKMELCMLRVLETVCGNVEGGPCVDGEDTTCTPLPYQVEDGLRRYK